MGVPQKSSKVGGHLKTNGLGVWDLGFTETWRSGGVFEN